MTYSINIMTSKKAIFYALSKNKNDKNYSDSWKSN